MWSWSWAKSGSSTSSGRTSSKSLYLKAAPASLDNEAFLKGQYISTPFSVYI